jgi:hypothetical protein
MRLKAIGSLLAGIALAGTAWLSAGHIEAPPALASPAVAPSSAPRALLLATHPGAAHTTLHESPIGGSDPGPPIASIPHLPDAAVRAAVLPGAGVVMMIADTAPGRDLSFNASLFRVEPHAPATPLCDRVVYASRPLVTATGRVFVSRGAAGPDPPIGPGGKVTTLRVDELSVDEVDPATGATRIVHAYNGYATFLAATWKDEIILYRVSPAGADLLALDPDSGAARKLADVPPFARSFSIDEPAAALLFEERHETDPRTWVIDRMDLTTGQRERLISSPHIALAPHAWPGGGFAYTPERRLGLTVVDAPVSVSGPLGPGVDTVEAIAPDGAWVALLHTPAGFQIPFAIRADTGEAAAIPAPSGARIAIAGFAAGEDAAR